MGSHSYTDGFGIAASDFPDAGCAGAWQLCQNEYAGDFHGKLAVADASRCPERYVGIETSQVCRNLSSQYKRIKNAGVGRKIVIYDIKKTYAKRLRRILVAFVV